MNSCDNHKDMSSHLHQIPGTLKVNLIIFAVLAILCALGVLPLSWMQAVLYTPFSIVGILSWITLALIVTIVRRAKGKALEIGILKDSLVVPLLYVNTVGMEALITLLSPFVIDPFRVAMDTSMLPSKLWILNDYLSNMASALASILVTVVVFSLALKNDGKHNGANRLRILLMALVIGTTVSWTINLLAPTVGPARFESSFSDMDAPSNELGDTDSNWGSSVPLSGVTPTDASPPLPVLWIALSLMAAYSKLRRLFWGLLPIAILVAAIGLLTGQFYIVDLLVMPALVATIWSIVIVAKSIKSEIPIAKPIWLNTGIVISGSFALGFGLALLAKNASPSTLSITGFILILSFIIIRSTNKITNELSANLSAVKSFDATAEHQARIQHSINRVLVLFFFSGLTGLIYEVVFERQLALIFGSTARSTTTVLAVYMAGLAIGVALGGRLSDRLRHPLRYYALVEGLVACICLVSPSLFELANQLYLGLVSGSNLSSATMGLLQVLCGALVVLLPAMLMGTTMPLLAKHATDEMGLVKQNIALLYSANTLGAASGTLLATYCLISAMGIEGALRLTTLINFFIAASAFYLSRQGNKSQTLPSSDQAIKAMKLGGSYGIALIVCAGMVGFITFGLEVLWVHLLAVVAGNSIYAFGLMLFAFLLGLGLGSRWIGRLKFADSIRGPVLATSIVALGLIVLLLLPLWDRIPPFLGLYSQVSFAHSFVQREFIRFSVCVGMMLAPTIIIGMIFPQIVALSTVSIDTLGRHIGLISFSNTLGDILGAVIVGLFLLPLLGSYRTAQFLGMMAVLLGGILLLWEHKRSKWLWSSSSIFLGFLIISLQGGWNMSALTAGTNVYFTYQSYGNVLEYLESVDGGISSIARTTNKTRTVTTMLTNGKFQGDDHDEMRAQCRFAFYPLLHCQRRQRALLIGLGTGVTGGVLLASGFKSLDVAELSADIADLAHRYFSEVNGHVLDDKRTSLSISDGRNFLLLGKQKYDLISIEISSIWFAGAANMYNKEFYELARDHIAPQGVLQQWIQLHHISPSDVASILATIRDVFPHVSLYFGGYQGVLVASMDPLNVDLDYVSQKLNDSPELKWYKGLVAPDGFKPLIEELLLSDKEIDEFVRSVSDCAGVDPEDLISTDSNRRLEYSTPKGNVRPHGMCKMADLLLKFRERKASTHNDYCSGTTVKLH